MPEYSRSDSRNRWRLLRHDMILSKALLDKRLLNLEGQVPVPKISTRIELQRISQLCIEEKEGLVSDDRFATGVKNVRSSSLPHFVLTYTQLCRFYGSLLKLGIVDPMVEEDTVEMAAFSLQNSRFEEANTLYKSLAVGRV